jgi:hypothetical protein
MTPSEMKTQLKGFTAVGIIVAVGGLVLMFFLKEMSMSTLMGASPQYKPNFPAVPTTDITTAAQCVQGYDKQWVGCQKLAQ